MVKAHIAILSVLGGSLLSVIFRNADFWPVTPFDMYCRQRALEKTVLEIEVADGSFKWQLSNRDWLGVRFSGDLENSLLRIRDREPGRLDGILNAMQLQAAQKSKRKVTSLSVYRTTYGLNEDQSMSKDVTHQLLGTTNGQVHP